MWRQDSIGDVKDVARRQHGREQPLLGPGQPRLGPEIGQGDQEIGATARIEVGGDLVEQEIRYIFTGELSAAVRAVVDPRKISWILESQFDLVAHRSTWRILPDHYGDRLTATGTTELHADGESTRKVTAGDVRIHMPLVGGRVERAIVSGLKEHAAEEAAALDRYLANTGG